MSKELADILAKLKEKIEMLEQERDEARAHVRRLQEKLAPHEGLKFYDCECSDCEARSSSLGLS